MASIMSTNVTLASPLAACAMTLLGVPSLRFVKHFAGVAFRQSEGSNFTKGVLRMATIWEPVSMIRSQRLLSPSTIWSCGTDG
ncbi:hypothetical protein ORS3428_16855 [Mesorhizobium sp. ORS 3428]|nr:hypothetical protein ORS3428_16855 [Mesorhizobium sp. ORS 3428]